MKSFKTVNINKIFVCKVVKLTIPKQHVRIDSFIATKI